MFSFGNPEYLYLLILLPVIIALFWFARRARAKKLQKFGQYIIADELMPDVSKYKPWIKLSLEPKLQKCEALKLCYASMFPTQC